MSDEKKEPALPVLGKRQRKGRPRKGQEINWAPIELQFKTSTLSAAEIARNFGLTDKALSQHALRHGWERDIDALKRREVKRALAGIGYDTIDQATQVAVGIGVAVTREHMQVVKDGRDLTHAMIKELLHTSMTLDKVEKLIQEETQGENSGAQARKLRSYVSLGTRAGTMRDLSNASRIWLSLERTIHGLADKADDDSTEIAQTLERLKKSEKPNSE